jgi:signal transduction histidine kinase/AraC-like DNA-binding protein/streptogramin lyase
MRTYHVAILLAFLPAILHSQTKPREEPLLIVPPGVSTRVERYTGMDPANLMQIRGLTADTLGFLWCYTNEGMARFDGYDLHLYRQDLADTGGKERTRTIAINVDGDGFIWMPTMFAGLKRLNPATGQSRWYQAWERHPKSYGQLITATTVSSNGELWVGGEFGLAMFDRKSDEFINFGLPSDPRVVGPVQFSSLCGIGRSVWTGLPPYGVAEFNRDSRSWRVFRHNKGTGSGPSNDTVRTVYGDRSGIIWVGTNSGLDRYDPASDSWQHVLAAAGSVVQSPRCPVTSLAEDDFGGIWIGTPGDGVFRFDPATGNFSHYCHDSADPNSLWSDDFNKVQAIHAKPRSGSMLPPSNPGNCIVWVTSGTNRVNRIIVRKDPGTSVLTQTRDGKGGPALCALLHDSPEKIWAVEYGGRIGLFDLQTRKAHMYPVSPLWRVDRLRDGTVLATGPGRTWKLDEKRDVFAPLAPDLRVYCSLEARDGTLWLGCSGKTNKVTFLTAIDHKTGARTFYPRQDPDSSSLPEGIVVRMCDDGRGAIWYGTFDGGVVRFDLEKKTYRRYAGKPGSDNALIANAVSALMPDSGGSLWVGTHAGLDLMDCDRGTFQHMRSPHPINELFIRNMCDDGEGHLWIAAEQNAVCFTKATRTFRMLTVPDQFRSKPLWEVSYVPQRRMVMFGGEGGFFMFSIDDPPAASPPPPVLFTSFKVFEKPYPLDGEVWSLKSITLPHSASFFSFTFAALDYLNSAKNQYSYRMEGIDPDWVESGSRRYVSYTNLDPGKYVLKVKGTNSEGIWNQGGAAIEIIVLPPWYRTIWAYGAYALLAGGFLFVLRRFDRRRAALKHSLEMKSFEADKMREVDQMKSSFFANISHEFRTPLTLILGPIDQLAGRFLQPDVQSTLMTMRRNGMRLLDLINQILDISRLDSGRMSVKVQPLDLVAHFRPLVMSFVSLAERKKINLIFDPKEKEIISYVDRDKVDKILTNLLSNAFKFTGEGGEIRVVLRIINGAPEDPVDVGAHPGMGTRGSKVEIVVSDTGIGIEAKDMGKIFDRFYQVESAHAQGERGTGIGLALTKELVDLHKGEISVESELGRGSTFTVRLPLGKEQWHPEDILTDESVPVPTETRPAPASLTDEEGADVEASEDPGKSVVLIVEDNADVRTYVRGFLQKNYTIEEAENGQLALEKARSVRIDLVISDVMMPVMDGVQLCRELKGDDRTNHIPVVLLTARATEEGKMEGLDIGADDYIVKPFEARELMARVKNLIEIRKTLRDKYRRNVTLGPAEIDVASADERFLKQLTETIEKHITDASYDTEKLAHDMCMSRMQLNRKLQALTGHSTHELVRQYRLQRAAQLLRKHAGNISEVAFESGFNSLSHFARAFRDQFGMLPSEYEASVPEKATRAKTREP